MHIIRRFLAIILCLSLLVQLTACTMDDVVVTTKNAVINKAEQAKDAVETWYRSIDLTEFENGWNNAVNYASSAFSATISSQYVEKVGASINALRDSMNTAYGSARSIAQEAGFAAEKWVAGTFNIDAAARQSRESAVVVGSNSLASVDVTTSYGENASLKFYSESSGSAQAQATSMIEAYNKYKAGSSNPLTFEEYLNKHGKDFQKSDLYSSIYKDQTRIIPADQLENAVQYLQGRINRLDVTGGAATDARATALQETLGQLKDRLESPDGTSSKPITYEEMQAIAEISQSGNFSPEDFGITTAAILTPKYILKQAIGAGAQSAAINAALSVGPELYSILVEAAKKENFDLALLKETGISGLLSGSAGFIEGSLSAVLVSCCKSGKMGVELTNASPEMIGALTVIVIDAVRYGYSLSKGDITPEDYGNLMAENVVVASGSLAGGALISLLLPASPIAYMAGCLAGSMMAVIGFTIAKEVVLEIKDSGGFEAVVPVDVVNGISIAKETIANLHISEKVSGFYELAITTVNEGLIKIKAA